ncbi:MAG: DUF1223 domain-containing protein [Acidobacteriota bacterium]|nr:DUF1223 domain-containing protein [Acidobacteriota bacterium]
MRPKRVALFAVCLTLLFPTGIWADDGRAPVIVELFTSEGCSSCPSADNLLARLEKTQPIENAHVIALEEHVDYWNQLGWKDRFSNPLFRGRQNDYAKFFQTDNIYTPQMVVSGQAQFVGDDAPRAYQEIGRAAANPKFMIRIRSGEAAQAHPDQTALSIRLKSLRRTRDEAATIYLAVTESNLSSNVGAGENAGHRLSHAPVVRSFGVIGKWDPKGSAEVELRPTLKLPNDWKRDNLRAVVFVQEKDTQRITGAAVSDLP